jgi:hypothetical protein
MNLGKKLLLTLAHFLFLGANILRALIILSTVLLIYILDIFCTLLSSLRAVTGLLRISYVLIWALDLFIRFALLNDLTFIKNVFLSNNWDMFLLFLRI